MDEPTNIILFCIYISISVQFIFQSLHKNFHPYFFFFFLENCVQTIESSSLITWHVNWKYQFSSTVLFIFQYNLKEKKNWTAFDKKDKNYWFLWYQIKFLYTWGCHGALYIWYLYQVHYILIEQIWFEKKIYLTLVW